MPNYEYKCQDCGHKFEKLQAYGEEPITTCPKCQGFMIRAINSTPAIFKGGKPSLPPKRATHKAGKHNIPVHQTEDGHYEQDRII